MTVLENGEACRGSLFRFVRDCACAICFVYTHVTGYFLF